MITFAILGITVAVSLISFNNRELFYKLLYSPYLVKEKKEYFRLVTHAVVHADMMHLMVNMYVLYSFGAVVEEVYGSLFGAASTWCYLGLYLGAVAFAALPALQKHGSNYNYNAVGASGAVSAVVFSSILFMPTAGMGILFIPIRIPAFLFGALYLFFEAYMNKRGGDNVAHDAHLWGGIFGVVFTIALKPEVGLFFIQEVTAYIGGIF